jgi:hypothetical protein
MSNNNSNSKKTVFCVYGIIVLLFLEAHTIAFGQILLDDTIYNLKGERAYEKRNAEITPWVEDGTPPKQGNAALLYYQAFLLRPEPNEVISNKIHKVAFGAEPDRQVRIYLGSCLDVIEVVEIASRMQQCTWGVWVKPVLPPSRGALRREIYSIYDILLMDARILAADGHYRVALERCLTALRIARHIREDPELYIFSLLFERYALRMVRYVLGVIPPDADILTWFRGQLGVVLGAPPSYAKRLQELVKAYLEDIRTYPTRRSMLTNLLVGLAEDEQAKESTRNLTDEQLLLRTGRGLQSFLDSIFLILDSEIAYEQKRADMQRIISKLTEADDTDPVIKDILIITNMKGTINREYPSYVEHHAYINGVKAAVEVYLVVAKTVQLPEKLPDGLPKDPSTGRDFIYEITDEGFALRCQDEKFLSRQSEKLEFKIKSKD